MIRFVLKEKGQSLECSLSYKINIQRIIFQFINLSLPSSLDPIELHLFDKKQNSDRCIGGVYTDPYITVDSKGSVKTKEPYFFDEEESLKVLNRQEINLPLFFYLMLSHALNHICAIFFLVITKL